MTDPALEGELEHFLPTEVFQLLRLAQATGRLTLSRPGEEAEVFFRAGKPLFVRTNGSSVRTGEILVHHGHATEAGLTRALADQRQSDETRPIGEWLIQSGVASPEVVRMAVQESLRRVLYGVLLWRAGRFSFHPDAHPPRSDIALDQDLDRLILDAMRLADQARREVTEPSRP